MKLLGTATLIGVLLAAGTAQRLSAQTNGPSMQAAPAESSINIDGRLDDEAWAAAEPAIGFRQFEPNEGAPATYRTEVRILYGENSLYVGATMFDDDVEAIEQALGRRDELNRADWFILALDSYFDRRTANVFAVNAAGVQFDGLMEPQSGGPGGGPDGGGPNEGYDESWDAVWYSDVSVNSEGWFAELRVPYSMLRFSKEEVQTWGIHLTRRIPRLGEQAEWPLVPRTHRGNLIAQFALLDGIRGVDPRRNIQFRPYAVSQVSTTEDPAVPGELSADTGMDVGGDVKIGLGTNVTLDATINPDFGQVESDPAVLNLTAFETAFEERRPFFVEGSQIFAFDVGPGQLIYSRRIGATGPIIGASKLSGRTANGFSFGILAATVGDDFDPERHYGLARISQQIGDYSSAGGILTGFGVPSASGRGRSVVAGADWDIRFANNRFGVEGFAAVTDRRFDGSNAETGFAGKTWARKRAGAWQGMVGLDMFSDKFNPNDLGRLDQRNFVALLNSIEHDVLGGRPFGPFQRVSLETFTIQQISYLDGLNLGMSSDLSAEATLLGFQEVRIEGEIQNPFGGYDPYETRGLGPWAAPARAQIGFAFETDERRSWQIEPELELGLDDNGGTLYSTGLRGNWNVGTRIAVEGDLEGEWENGVRAWSSNETFWNRDGAWHIGSESAAPSNLGPDDYLPIDGGALLNTILADAVPLTDDHYYVPVFGVRDTRSLDLTVRTTVTFTPVLSVQLYSQFFLARGRYDDFQIMQNRDHLVGFDAFPKRDDFSFGSLQSNLVLRWEYRPGSSLYGVWTHGRRSDDRLNPLGPWVDSPYERAIGEHLRDTFGVFPDNTFLIKLDYTFLY